MSKSAVTPSSPEQGLWIEKKEGRVKGEWEVILRGVVAARRLSLGGLEDAAGGGADAHPRGAVGGQRGGGRGRRGRRRGRHLWDGPGGRELGHDAGEGAVLRLEPLVLRLQLRDLLSNNGE